MKQIKPRSLISCFIIFPIIGAGIMALGSGLVCYLLNLSVITRTSYSGFVITVFSVMGFAQGFWYAVAYWKYRHKNN